MECEEVKCHENCFDPNNDPKDGCEDGSRDRAPDWHLPVVMGIWCCVFLCFAMTRHDSKIFGNFVKKVNGFRLVQKVRVHTLKIMFADLLCLRTQNHTYL